MFAFSTLAVAASLVATVAANHGHGLHPKSHHVGRSNLQKRFNGQATYYAVGLGACGQTNVASDFIVALNTAQFGDGYPGPNCFKPITICAKGKCVGATIMDACPTCAYGALDLSESLFKQFADTGDGVFQMTWTFDGDAPAPTPTKKPDPTTTKKPEPEPTTTTKKPEPTTTWEEPTTTSSKKKTSTWSPPPETTSWTPEPTTSSTSTSSKPTTTSSSTSTVVSTTTSVSSTSIAATTSATSTSSTSSASSTSAAPSASASSGSTSSSGNKSGSGSGSNLADAQQAMIALGRMVVAAH